jgi:hypothetical protein
MKNFISNAKLAGIASVALLLLMSASSFRGGYSYTLHLNNKLVSEQYLTSKFETPVVLLTDQDLKETLTVYFNECGEIGRGRKLSVRTPDQKILKEWSYANSTMKHDPMGIVLKEIAPMLNTGKLAVYYSSERVTKPQILAQLTIASNKNKVASR